MDYQINIIISALGIPYLFDQISVRRDRLLVLKLLALVFGCLAKFITGSLFTFNVYQNDIKTTFGYTQKEVEVMSSMLNIGLGVGFLPGMFYDRFGPQWASTIGLVVSVGAYMLLWSTTRSGLVHFYSNNAWLMSIYFFTAGLGSVFTYMVALNTNIINFDQKHTGKVVGLLNAFFAGSPSIFAVLYYHVFKHGDSHDYPGFMLMFAISFGIADLLCVIFVRVYKEPNTNTDTKRKETSDDENQGIEYKKMENPSSKIQESSGGISDEDQGIEYKKMENPSSKIQESSGDISDEDQGIEYKKMENPSSKIQESSGGINENFTTCNDEKYPVTNKGNGYT